MKKRGWILLLAAVLLLAVGCGGSEKILSTEGVPQEVLQSAQYKAALAEETATVIAYNYVPLTDSAPVRAAVKKMQAGEDAELRYYNFYDRNDCQGIDGMRLTVKDGVAAFQEISLTGYGDTVDWENVLYQQAEEIKLNSCGELSLIESMDHTYIVFSPLDTYEDYNKRYELTKTYLYPLAEGCTQNFTSPEGITDPLWWARLCWFLTDGETDYPEGHEVPIDEIEEVLLKWFDISEEKLRSLLDPDGNGTMLWVTETGISWSCFAKEAVREGDLLRIRYGFTFNGREPNYNRELTVRIAEDGSWKYVSNRTVPTELENGVTAMSIDGMLSGSGWQPLYTCMVQDGDGYNEVFHAAMEPKLLADGILAIPVIPGTSYKDGAPIAVMMLHTDGSYEVIKTPLTCGDWMKMSYSGGEIRYTSTETAGESLIIRTEYSTDIGVRNPYNRIDRLVETEVWSDGRVESRDYVPEGSRYTMLKSPDGQHIADSAENGSLTIDGVTVIETGLDREIWEYDRYYRPELWLDNDRLVISSNYYRYSNDYGIFTLSTGEVTWMNLGKMNGNGLSGIRLLDGKLFWTVMNENFFTDDESGSVSEMAFYSLPVEELPYGTPTRMATKLYYGMEHNGRLWTAETNYTATGHLTVLAFDPESGESAELDIPVAEWLDGGEQSRSWTCNAIKMTAQGMVLCCTQYIGEEFYGTDWLIMVPHAMLDKMEWQRLPSVLDSAEEIPLTEIEEIFGGRWQDMEYGDGYTLTIYRDGDAIYCRCEDMEPQQLVKAYKTGKTGYYITTRRADGTTDALALDTGKPKDNKITAMLYEWRNLTYQGEA
jgi:lipoprotein